MGQCSTPAILVILMYEDGAGLDATSLHQVLFSVVPDPSPRPRSSIDEARFRIRNVCAIRQKLVPRGVAKVGNCTTMPPGPGNRGQPFR